MPERSDASSRFKSATSSALGRRSSSTGLVPHARGVRRGFWWLGDSLEQGGRSLRFHRGRLGGRGLSRRRATGWCGSPPAESRGWRPACRADRASLGGAASRGSLRTQCTRRRPAAGRASPRTDPRIGAGKNRASRGLVVGRLGKRARWGISAIARTLVVSFALQPPLPTSPLRVTRLTPSWRRLSAPSRVGTRYVWRSLRHVQMP